MMVMMRLGTSSRALIAAAFYIVALTALPVAMARADNNVPVVNPSNNSDMDAIVPPLYGVGYVVISPPVLQQKSAALDCGVEPDLVLGNMQRLARASKMHLPQAGAEETIRNDIFTLHVVPEIYTIRQGGVTCVSWVSLRAEASHTVLLPPIQHPKVVTITYWSKGGLLVTPILEHGATVEQTFERLMSQLILQWEEDNPHYDDTDSDNGTAAPNLEGLPPNKKVW